MRVKRTLQPYVLNDKIKFGFGNVSLERDIDCNEMNINLIKKLDEDVDIQQLSIEERKIVKFMLSKGLLTNNQYDDTKYSRNINFFEWIDLSKNLNPCEYQKRLLESTVLIVGVGGIGSTVVEILARLGVGRFIIVDFDIVEESNLTRQSGFKKSDIGKSKVEVIQRNIQAISDSKVVTISKQLRCKNDLEKLFKSYSFNIALCCADTPSIEIDYWFDDLAHKYNKPIIVGSYASTVINYLHIIPGETLSLREFYGNFMISDDHILNSKTPYSVISPISYMAAAIISYKVLDSLTGLLNITNYIQIDCMNFEVYQHDIRKIQ